MNKKTGFVWAAVVLSSALGACRSSPPDQGAQTQTTPSAPVPSASSPGAGEGGAAAAGSGSANAGDASVASAADSGTNAATPPAEEKLEGQLFTKEVQAAFRVAACAGDDAFIPTGIDAKMVEAHCKALTANYAEYKKEWLDVAGPFLAKLRPANLPSKVFYPFGGGDLVSALATYPDLTEVTTISLEIAGDIRPILKTDTARLRPQLSTLRDHLAKLFLKAHSRTENLNIETRGAIPGEVAFTMAALAIHGFEPVTLRYFDFQPDGALHYFTDEEITKSDTAKNGRNPFANAEIRFRKPGEAKVRILRHVAYDLSDDNLKKAPALLKHLESWSGGGKLSTMTKAASHLLWDDAHFATIRDFLMTHTDWMISDTTGVPPRIAKKYGFEQDVYGLYEWPEPFGTVNNDDARAFKTLYKDSKPISFRYGYPDNNSHGHILVTHKAGVVGAGVDAGAPAPATSK